MSGTRDRDRYLVPGLVRGIEVLRHFSADQCVLTAAGIARAMDIPRSTVFRLAHTLEHLGLLERVDDGHTFRLGIGVLTLGFEYLGSLDMNEIARPRLEKLRDLTGLATHLVVRDGRDVVIILKLPGRGAFSGGLTVGSRLPAHATVLGRVMLADLDGPALGELYDHHPLERYSTQTPTTVGELETILAGDRRRGYAVSRSFFESGVSAAAAPVRDASGRVVGAINATVFTAEDVSEELIARVMSAAEDISRALGGKPGLDRAANF